MKLSVLIEMLNNSKDFLGDVEVLVYDFENKKEIKISGVNNEGDHVEIV